MEEHFFTAHTSARLTFVVGIVIGISIMTLGGLAFFTYVFSGGEIGTYAVAPLDTSSKILDEPIKSISTETATAVAEPAPGNVYGATENYKVTLVDYTDYECRFCKKFFPDLKALVDAHPDTIRLIVKQYPLVQIHPNAHTAAIAADCAGEQGKLMDYSLSLYTAQDDLADPNTYTSLADTLQLDAQKFADCRGQTATADQIETDAAEAVKLGIKSQPNLVIVHSDDTLDLVDGYVSDDYLESLLAKDLK